MIAASSEFKEKVLENGRRWSGKLVINDDVYTSLNTTTIKYGIIQGQDLSIGNTYMSTLETTIPDVEASKASFQGQKATMYIGLWLDDEGDDIEWIKIGVFNIREATKDDKNMKISASDNMMKANFGFSTKLSGSQKIQTIMNEQCANIGCSFAGGASDMSIDVSKLEGLKIIEVFQLLASLSGKNAIANRDGNIEFRFFEEVDYTITPDKFSDPLTIGETPVEIKRIICAIDDETQLKAGEEVGKTLSFSNQFMTQERLNSIYNDVIKPFSYRTCNVNMVMGNPALDVGDIVQIKDKRGNIYKIPLFLITITFTGGVSSVLEATASTEEQDNYSYKGTITEKVERAYFESISTKELVADTIIAYDGKFVKIETDYVQVNKKLTALEAEIGDLDVGELTAKVAQIEQAYISKAEVQQLYATKAEVGTLDADVANIKTLLAGSTTTGDLQSIVINSKNATIENGTIKNAMIESLAFDKITGVDINTTKLTVHSNDGKSTWKDNTIQISDGNRTRVQVGKDASNDYNIYIWDKSGKLMFDATGVTADGIQRPIIRDDMVSDTASIAGHKLNIQSVVKEINGGTEKIKSSTVLYDPTGQTMDIAFNEMVSNSLSGGFEYEGNSYSGKASDYGIEIREVEGAYSQKTTKGYQLFDASRLSTTTNGGATVKNNGDGSFTVSGSGTMTSSFGIAKEYNHSEFVAMIKTGNITLNTGRTGNRVVPNVYFNIVDTGTQKAVLTCYENQTQAVKQEWLNDEKYVCRIGFYAASGNAIVTGTIKPMLYQQGDGTYEEFTGGLPMPNPDYPSTPKFFTPTKFFSNTRNLFDQSKFPTKTIGGATLTNNGDGSFTISGSGNLTRTFSYENKYSNGEIINSLQVGDVICINASSVFPRFEVGTISNETGSWSFIIASNNATSGVIKHTIVEKNLKNAYFRVNWYGPSGSAIKTGTYKPMIWVERYSDGTWEKFQLNSIDISGFGLAALPNGVKDTFNNGDIVANINNVVLNGTESWAVGPDSAEKSKYGAVRYYTTATASTALSSSKIILSNRFTQGTNDDVNSKPYTAYISQNGNLNVYVENSKFPKLSDWVTYLKSNNTSFWYQLLTPTLSSKTMPVIPSYYPYTIAYHNSEVPAHIKWFIRTQITSKEYSNLSTQVSIANGEISTLISKTTQMQTDLTDAKGSITELTTKYNQVKQTVDSYGVTIGEHTSKIETANKNIKEVSDKQSSMQLDLDGFKTSVSKTYSTKTETTTAKNEAISTASKDAQTKADKAKTDAISSANANTANLLKSYSTTAQMNSAIQQSANSITQKVTAVETKVTTVTNTVNNNKATWDKAGTALTTANEAKEAANLADKTYKSTVDLSASTYDKDTFYPVVGSAISNGKGYHKFQCNVELNSGTKPSWSTHAQGFSVNITARIKYPGWGANDYNTLGWIDDFSYRYADQMPAYISVMVNSSYPVFYLRGGGKYFLFTDYSCTWSVKTSKYEYNSESVSPIKLPSKPSNSSYLANNWEQRTELKETVSKVATIEVNLDSITSRVSKTESSITSVDGKVTSLTTRVTTAESKITDTAIVNTVRSSTSYKSDLNGKVSSNQIISTINQTAEAIKISASKIQLEGIVTANSRFKILTDGSMEAVNGKFSGTITATAGKIGGWTIINSQMECRTDVSYKVISGSTASTSDFLVIQTGSSGNYKYPFYVHNDGFMHAENAEITGRITASTISGSTITGGSITSGTNINVSTDLHVGNNIYLNQNTNSNKKIVFASGNEISNLYSGNINYISIHSNYRTSLTSDTGSYVAVTGSKYGSNGGDIEISANNGKNIDFLGYYAAYFHNSGIYSFRESSGSQRNVLRPINNSGAYLGTTSARWNTAFFTNSITASDLKEKQVLDRDMKSRDFIMGLKPISYHRTGENDKGERIHMGFGAQDVNSLIKELGLGNMSIVQASVIDGGEERPYHGEEVNDRKLSWGLNYTEFIPPMVGVIQIHNDEISKLKDEIAQLQSKLNAYIDGTVEIKRA